MQFAMQQCVIIDVDRQNRGPSSLLIKVLSRSYECCFIIQCCYQKDPPNSRIQLGRGVMPKGTSTSHPLVQVTRQVQATAKLHLTVVQDGKYIDVHVAHSTNEGCKCLWKEDPGRLHQSTSMLIDLVGNLFLAEICSTPFSSLARMVEGSQSLARNTSRLNLPILLSYMPLDDKAKARVTGFHGKYCGSRQVFHAWSWTDQAQKIGSTKPQARSL